MLPIQHQTRLPHHRNEIQLRVRLPQTVMRPRAKDKPVLDLFVGVTRDPALGVPGLRVRVGFRVVCGGPDGGDDHHALFHFVVGRDLPVLFGFVGDHDDGRAVAEGFFDDGAGCDHGLKSVHVEALVAVAVAEAEVFLADLGEPFGPVGEELEEPGAGGGGGVLGGEEEGEDGHGDFPVREVAQDHGGFLGLGDLDALGDLRAVPGGFLLLLDPGVHDAGDGAAGGHAGFGFGGAFRELVEDHVGGFLAVPAFGEGEDYGEVDEF